MKRWYSGRAFGVFKATMDGLSLNTANTADLAKTGHDVEKECAIIRANRWK